MDWCKATDFENFIVTELKVDVNQLLDNIIKQCDLCTEDCLFRSQYKVTPPWHCDVMSKCAFIRIFTNKNKNALVDVGYLFGFDNNNKKVNDDDDEW